MYGITHRQNLWHIKINDVVVLTIIRNIRNEYRIKFSTPLGEKIMGDIIKMIDEEYETDKYKRGYKK